MKKLYVFDVDYYYGYVGGMFVAEESEVEEMCGNNIYFGEIMGKHSEVELEFEISDFDVYSEDESIINAFMEKAGDKTIVGYNPVEEYQEQKEDGRYDDE